MKLKTSPTGASALRWRWLRVSSPAPLMCTWNQPQQVLRDPRCDLMVAEVRRLFDLGDERGDLVKGQSFACGKPPEGGAVGGRSQISWRQAVFRRVRLAHPLRPPVAAEAFEFCLSLCSVQERADLPKRLAELRWSGAAGGRTDQVPFGDDGEAVGEMKADEVAHNPARWHPVAAGDVLTLLDDAAQQIPVL